MTKPKLDQKRALAWRAAATLMLLAAAVYVLRQHWATVSTGLQVARGASVGWLALSLLAMALTFCIAAAVYGVLALHRLRYRQTLLVSVAAAFAGRLLPAGLGGLGLNGVYLYRRRHTPAEATVIVSVNNLLGMAAHVLLLAALLVFKPGAVRSLLLRHHVQVPWTWGVAVVVLVCLAVQMPAMRRPLAGLISHLADSVRRLSLANVLLAMLLSAMLTATYTFVLYGAVRSIGGSLGLFQVFVVFSFGMLAGTVTPTPGGLVGAEAGLFAGFVAYGATQADAAATVLLFRLVTYWLPLIPGVVALWAARARSLV